MRIFIACLLFFCSFELPAMDGGTLGTIYKVSESNRGLNGYVRLRVLSYFPVKVLPSSREEERECLLKNDEKKIARCRNGIVLKSNLNSWFNSVNFQKMSPAFKDVLQKHVPGIRAYGVQPPNDKKLSIVVSRTFSWAEGIALIRKVYGDARSVDIKTLEDSLFLIFLHILPPGFWDYPLSLFSEDERKRKLVDERFFNNCMEEAIARYMEKVNKYDGPTPLDECEKYYCSDKKKLD